MTKYTGLRRIDQLLDRAKETVNERGNRVRHLLLPGDRFLFDFNLDLGLWEQFDTENDASYFGVLSEEGARRFTSLPFSAVYAFSRLSRRLQGGWKLLTESLTESVQAPMRRFPSEEGAWRFTLLKKVPF